MAYASNEDELKQKTAALCIARYGVQTKDTMKKLFASYDTSGDGGLDTDELIEMLKDADVGNFVTRKSWAKEIFLQLDKTPHDDRITWEEYLAASSSFGTAAKPSSEKSANDLLDDLAKGPKTVTTLPAPPLGPPGGGATLPPLAKGAIAIGAALLLGHWLS